MSKACKSQQLERIKDGIVHGMSHNITSATCFSFGAKAFCIVDRMKMIMIDRIQLASLSLPIGEGDV